MNSETQNPNKLANTLDATPVVVQRPDLMMRSEVIGLTVPAVDISKGSPVGRWRLWLKWADGKRERHWLDEVSGNITLPNGTRVYLCPSPAPPSVNLSLRWSLPSQKAWEDGAEAVDPVVLFNRLRDVFSNYLDIPMEYAEGTTATLALWVMLTYTFQAWDAVPYLYVGGPAGSGKSRVFELLDRVVNRPLPSSNITAAAAFRGLHDSGGTLLLDEAERLKDQTPDAGDLRSILLAGYKRGGTATRCERSGSGASFNRVEFDVFGPKAVACIAGLPPALLSRCIPIIMFRSPPDSAKPRLRIDGNPSRWSDLRDGLHCLVLDHGGAILEVANRADACPAMSGRNYELWQPLMALASWIEENGVPGLLGVTQAHAQRVIDLSQEDHTSDVDEILLRKLVESVRDANPLTPMELLRKAKEEDLETFKNFTARMVSNVLKRYGVTAVRSNGKRVYRTGVADIRRIELSYGLDLGCAEAQVGEPPL